MNMYVYADNAATTKMSDVAIAAMLPYLNEIYGNPSSLHSVGQQANEALCSARERMAALLGTMRPNYVSSPCAFQAPFLSICIFWASLHFPF